MMKTPKLAIAIVISLFGACFTGQNAFCDDQMHFDPKEASLVPAMRSAGLTGDDVKLPILEKTLATSKDPALTKTVLHSLAQLGNADAVPVIDEYLQTRLLESQPDKNLVNFARVEKSRTLAEDAASQFSDSRTKAQIKISRLFQGLGLTPIKINAVSQAYKRAGGDRSVMTHEASITPIEVVALREIADLVYHGSYQDYAALPEVAQLDFQSDYAAWLKWQLAPMTHAQRITWLVQDLSHKHDLPNSVNYELRLLVDEGPDAGLATAETLVDMNSHREKYDIAGFDALLDILGSQPGESSKQVLELFSNDANPEIAHYARNYPRVAYVPGY